MGHTVWYTVMGTGDPVTIDTSCSDSDTVAMLFAPDDDGLTEIACADDVVHRSDLHDVPGRSDIRL